MKTILVRTALIAGIALGAAIPAQRGAAAAPVIDQSPAAPELSAPTIEKAYWVCGPYRCWWRPRWHYWHRRHYWRGYYWHRPYWRRHYWHRPYYRHRWHRWHRWHYY